MKNKYFKIFSLIVTLIAVVSCSTNENVQEIKKTEIVSAKYEYNDVEKELIAVINNYRLSKGFNSLVVDNYVSIVSEGHAKYMIDKNTISHDLFNNRYLNLVNALNATKVSENVAYNFNTAQSTLNAWVNSPEHKINLEGDFTHFGISVKTSPTGVKFYTNIFMKK